MIQTTPEQRQDFLDAHAEGLHDIPREGCPDCNRPIERDPLRGKPVNAKGYCLGTDTCIQRP